MSPASLLVFLFLGLLGPQDSDPVEQEFRVRRGAFGTLDQVEIELAESDWRAKYRVLDALNRRTPGRVEPAEAALAAGWVRDEHPNVRALALAVHARHGLLLTGDVEELLKDPMPHVRRGLARALLHGSDAEANSKLLDLASDSDGTVALEACAQLFSKGECAGDAQISFMSEQFNRMEPALFLSILDVLDRSNGSTAEYAPWPGPVAEPESSALSVTRYVLWLTLVDRLDDRDMSGIVSYGWLNPIGASGSPEERQRRARLERYASFLPERAQFVERLLDRAEEFGRVALADEEGRVDAERSAHELLVGALQVHFAPHVPGPTGEVPTIADFPMRASWSAAFTEDAWSSSFGRANAWGASAAAGLGHEDEDVRFAAWHTLSEVWSRTGELETALWLADVMADEALAPEVYRSFVRSERELPDGEVLHSWWAQQTTSDRLELLHEHWTGRAYTAWRADLVELWTSGEGRERVVLELLGQFEGDQEVAGLLWESLDKELRFLHARENPDEEVTRGPWREAEARALWLLEAWEGVQGPGGVKQRRVLLLRVRQLGKELGKLLIPSLARSSQGREVLEEILMSNKLSSRLNYEVLLNGVTPLDPRPLDNLWIAYRGCDDDLKLRILKRAAGEGGALPRALLIEVALDAEAGLALRLQAVDSLAQDLTGPAGLARVFKEVGDYEVKQVALAQLGGVADEHESLALLALYGDELERSLLGDELLSAMVRIEVRTLGALSPEVLAHWRNLPGDAAATELASRFVSRRLPGRDFTYSGWLEGAQALARSGLLEVALGDDWLTWDGRLLTQLARLVRNSAHAGAGPLALRLTEGARIALLGEGPARDRAGRLARLQARLLSGSLAAEDWPAALARVHVILDGWRSGRIPDSAIEWAFGPTAIGLGRDPRTALLALEVECQLRLATSAEERARLLPRARDLSQAASSVARTRLGALLEELPR